MPARALQCDVDIYGIAVDVVCPFMALLSFRGIDTPSLAAQGGATPLLSFQHSPGQFHDVPLHQVNRCLRERAAIEEIGVVAEDCNAGGDLHAPRSPRLGNTQLGSERPAVVA